MILEANTSHLRYFIIIMILGREKRRSHDGAPEQLWFSVSIVGDNVLQYRASSSRTSPYRDFWRVAAKGSNLPFDVDQSLFLQQNRKDATWSRTHCKLNCWSTVFNTIQLWYDWLGPGNATNYLRSPALRTPFSLTCCPGKNPYGYSLSFYYVALLVATATHQRVQDGTGCSRQSDCS